MSVLRLCMLLGVCLVHTPWTSATEDYVAETELPKLRRIETLTHNCAGKTCRNFSYPNRSEVAYFDLKPEIRISADSTYDISNPIDYDTLSFENSTFFNFPNHLFHSLRLKELDVRNCSIKILTWENFLMSGELTILLLSNNEVQKISEMTFNYATELQYLFLDSNRIRTLVSESFKGLTKLRYLNLKDNRIRELPVGIFDYLPSLQELNLAENRLRNIGNDLFLNTPLLNTVILSDNKLSEIGEYAFRTLTNLILLDLSDNKRLEICVMNIQVRYLVASNCSLYRVNIYGSATNVDMRDNHILELYFAQPEQLEMLNLRNNALEQIASLTRATNLQSLNLADNPALGSLPQPWALESLVYLDLSNTSMSVLPINSLAEHTNLKSLNVSHNQLQQINPRNFKHLQHLTHFYIHANDWNCYQLRTLMELLIIPHGMTFTRDEFDPDFPGEYIQGIACMYRLEDQEDQQLSTTSTTNEGMMNDKYVATSQQFETESPTAEVESLRKELKSIVLFYEQKFDKIFDKLNELDARLAAFEQLNGSFWQHVTITT